MAIYHMKTWFLLPPQYINAPFKHIKVMVTTVTVAQKYTGKIPQKVDACHTLVFVLSVYLRMPVSCCAVTACIEKSAASFPGLHSSFGLSCKTGRRWPPFSGKW